MKMSGSQVSFTFSSLQLDLHKPADRCVCIIAILNIFLADFEGKQYVLQINEKSFPKTTLNLNPAELSAKSRTAAACFGVNYRM